MLKYLIPLASLLVTTPALALTHYNFNRYIGNIWVSDATVESYLPGTRIGLNLNNSSCDAGYHLEGDINISYYSDDNGHMTNYRVYPAEGTSGWFYITSPYNMSETGTLYIQDNQYCEWSGFSI